MAEVHRQFGKRGAPVKVDFKFSRQQNGNNRNVRNNGNANNNTRRRGVSNEEIPTETDFKINENVPTPQESRGTKILRPPPGFGSSLSPSQVDPLESIVSEPVPIVEKKDVDIKSIALAYKNDIITIEEFFTHYSLLIDPSTSEFVRDWKTMANTIPIPSKREEMLRKLNDYSAKVFVCNIRKKTTRLFKQGLKF